MKLKQLDDRKGWLFITQYSYVKYLFNVANAAVVIVIVVVVSQPC